MTKLLLLALGTSLGLAGIIYAARIAIIALLSHAIIAGGACRYADSSSFDKFVMQQFQVGSNAQDAMAKMRLEGYRDVSLKPGLYSFSMARVLLRGGPACTDIYSIDLR